MSATSRHRHRFRVRSLDDAALVLGCREGDEASWAELVARYGAGLRRIARSCGLDGAAADDAVQVAWCQLLCSIDQLHDGGAVRGWLATTVRRAAVQTARRQQRTRLSVGRETDPAAIEEALLAAERVHAVRLAVNRLDRADRRLLGLLFGDECSYREVAGAVGRPVGSIGPTRARVLRRLAEVLGEAA